METYIIDEEEYHYGDDILKYAPVYCCRARTSRELIRKKNINIGDYIYAKQIKNSWAVSDGKSCKFDKVFIKKDYLKDVKELNGNTCHDEDENGVKYRSLPDILQLSDEEKFKDDDGNIVEIETRGERKPGKIFFKVKDVAGVFNMPTLHKVITKDDTSYAENKDFMYFTCGTTRSGLPTKKIYLTHQGLLRVLFVSRNDKTSGFFKWATETLFIHQFGTTEQKQKLFNKTLGTSANVSAQVFSRSSHDIACVYLFSVGTVKTLRQTLSIPDSYDDNYIVVKYGFTNNLERRTKQHSKTYGAIRGADLRLMKYCNIDEYFIREAESKLREHFSRDAFKIGVDDKECVETAIIKPSDIISINGVYDLINKTYIGVFKNFESQLINERKQHTSEVELLKSQRESFERQYNDNVKLMSECTERIQIQKELYEKRIDEHSKTCERFERQLQTQKETFDQYLNGQKELYERLLNNK